MFSLEIEIRREKYFLMSKCECIFKNLSNVLLFFLFLSLSLCNDPLLTMYILSDLDSKRPSQL